MIKMFKEKLLKETTNLNGIWFHIIGIIAIIWFLVRVVPSPHRIRYPCQQMSITIALGYITFWSIIFQGLLTWIKKMKIKTNNVKLSIIAIFTVSSLIFGLFTPILANISTGETTTWNPITKEPIGIPVGVKPGRVVWIWDKNATEQNLNGYWWKATNNNQLVIQQMFSSGIKTLASKSDDQSAWDTIFKNFNQKHGNGNVGYQPGEKIAIKINLNNCWLNPYTEEDSDADANPYVVKSLLNQLVNIVGIAQNDIYVYDALRTMANWFYEPLSYEFPNINYVDCSGGATGRQKMEASGINIYFTNGMHRTLPTCITNAKYLINMPLLKRHSLSNGVTLSGKNHFGSFTTSPYHLHDYHENAFTTGNPAPQTDIHAHEHLGGKTLLYIGDALFASPEKHYKFAKFQMYPFNNDWTNSLFFSQDGVAIDSVMYDFLNVEGDPPEGSQNYLHQSADPPTGVYDPENDGNYLTISLGVHEHWDTSINIFSSDRYSGTNNNGIEFIYCNPNELSINNPPYIPVNLNPINEATNISIDVDISWIGGDPDIDDTVTYDVYFGTNTNPPKVSNNQSITSYDPGQLEYEETYYWKIVSWDSQNESTESSIWTFKTKKEESYDDNQNGPTTNQPPIANISIRPPNDNYIGYIGETIIFDGSNSYDPDDEIKNWYWDFGNGKNGTGEITSYIYSKTGTYTVVLTVTDKNNVDDSISKIIDIRNKNRAPSNPIIYGENTGEKNNEYSFTVVSKDLDNNSIKYVFNWSDGTNNTITNYIQNNTNVTVNHTWTKKGYYEIEIYAEDENLAKSDITKWIILIDVNIHYIDDIISGYLIDYEMDGNYSVFHNNATGKKIELEITKNGTYMIDVDGNGEYDYIYSIEEGLKRYTSEQKKKSTPGFELIITLIAILFGLFVFIKRKN